MPEHDVEKRQFEIRYKEVDQTEDYRVLGWHDTVEGACKMATAWGLRPGSPKVWVVDLARQA